MCVFPKSAVHYFLTFCRFLHPLLSARETEIDQVIDRTSKQAIREDVNKKLAFLADLSTKRGGVDHPAAKKFKFFLKKKCFECSETKEYAKIFCDISTGYQLITWPFFTVFFLWCQSFFSSKIIHFRLFLFQNIYIYTC